MNNKSTSKKLAFGGHELQLLPEGCLYWKDENLLVVSDLHLEKGSSFVANGVFVPPHDTCETLSRLNAVLHKTKAIKLLLLGDSFHDENAYHRLDEKCRHDFSQLCENYEIIWIEGNHERGFVPPGLTSYESLDIKGLIFRHIAKENNQDYEISGHYHPCATIRHKGKATRKRCFVTDNQRIIMPAFGTYTGSLDVLDPAIRSLMDNEFVIHMSGGKKIYTFPSEILG